MRLFCAALAGVLCLGVSEAQIPQPIRDSSFDWRCVGADGTVVSNHQRQDTAIYSCQSAAAAAPGATFYIEGGRYRVSVSGQAPPPPVEPPPEPDPDPDPTPDPDPDPVPPPDPDPDPVPPPTDPLLSVTQPSESSMSEYGPVTTPTVFPTNGDLEQRTFRWEIHATLNTLPDERYGLVSRDESGQAESGHLSVWVLPDGKVVARHQGLSDSTDFGDDDQVTLTSTTSVVAGESFVVTISIGTGGTALFLGEQLEASHPISVGLGGNTLSLLVGGGCTTCEGGTTPITYPADGEVELRIFNSESDWAPPPPVTGSITLEWMLPTEYEDGGPLEPGELLFTSVYVGSQLQGRMASPGTMLVLNDVPDGQRCYNATVTTIENIDSRPSNEVCATISPGQ